MTRAEKVARAQGLRAEGRLLREIAAEMGSSRTAVSSWLSDPDLSKQRARRERYAGACTECGARTTGCNGYDAPTICRSCHGRAMCRARAWTREALIDRIREWAEIHGEPPAGADWNGWKSRHGYHDDARAERFEREGWPGFTTVVNVFGSWNAGLEAAGFEPRAPHGGDGNQRRSRRARATA